MSAIGERIRKTRLARGLTQEQAARSICGGLRARVGPSAAKRIEPLLEILTPNVFTWSRWEQGVRTPGPMHALLLRWWAE